MLEILNTFAGTVGGFLYNNILVYALIIIGIYFTIRLKGVQFVMFPEMFRVIGEKTENEGNISSFEALMIATASRVGTGNIVGISTAICLGGFGSVFWMWVIALIGGASSFVECTLAQIYKKRGADGKSFGGPAYYIQQGLHSKGLGVLFSVLLLCTFGCGFIMLASFNLVDSFSIYFDGDFYGTTKPIILGAIVAVLFALCIFKGSKQLAIISSVMVPIMGAVYIVVAVIMVIVNIRFMPSVFTQIFSEAFDFKAIMGGFSGSCLMYGVKRGLFSNEAGLGSAPNAAAAADVTHPAKHGLLQILSVFLNTIVICSATAFMCMSSGIVPSEELAGITYVQVAVGTLLGKFGYVFITFSMALFAFSTLLGNCFYAEPNLRYILGKNLTKKQTMLFYTFETVVVFLGGFLQLDVVWNFADMMMAVMAIVNLPVIVLLGKKAFDCLDDYRRQKKEGKDPVFKAADIGVTGTDYWN